MAKISFTMVVFGYLLLYVGRQRQEVQPTVSLRYFAAIIGFLLCVIGSIGCLIGTALS